MVNYRVVAEFKTRHSRTQESVVVECLEGWHPRAHTGLPHYEIKNSYEEVFRLSETHFQKQDGSMLIATDDGNPASPDSDA